VSLAPLLNADPAIQVHAFAAMAAFALGVVQLAAPKGTLPHRTVGWIWVVLVLDPRSAGLGPVESDPSAVDLHAGDVAARGPARQASSGRPSPQCHDRYFHRRSRHCRRVHLRARPHHARGSIWPIVNDRPEQRPRGTKLRKSSAAGGPISIAQVILTAEPLARERVRETIGKCRRCHRVATRRSVP
jgi:hypothetical protein